MDFDGDGLFDDALVDAGWRRARRTTSPSTSMTTGCRRACTATMDPARGR